MKEQHTDSYGATIVNDALALLMGKLIQKGTYRDVYEFPLNETLVVKVEARDATFCNQTEWGIWTESKDHEWRKWLAPCHTISDYGTVLIQFKTTPLPAAKRPRRVPNFLADLKLENWGLYEGRPVVHDYGNHNIFTLAKRQMRLVAGNWHDGKGGKLE